MLGQLTRHWIEATEAGRAYYQFIDDLKSGKLVHGDRAYDPLTGQMTGTPSLGDRLGAGLDTVAGWMQTIRETLSSIRSIWNGEWPSLNLTIGGNIEAISGMLERIKGLWDSIGGTKMLNFGAGKTIDDLPQLKTVPNAPAPQTTAPGKGDRLDYTPRLAPAGGSVTLNLNVQGTSDADFRRYAIQIANAVKNAQRNSLNDGLVPQAV